MPYILDLIIMITARMLGIVLEDLMRDRLDDFNRCLFYPQAMLIEEDANSVSQCDGANTQAPQILVIRFQKILRLGVTTA